MKFNEIKEVFQKYHMLTKLFLGTFVVFFNLIMLYMMLAPKLTTLFPNTPSFIFLLHFFALFLLWVLAMNKLIKTPSRRRAYVECIMLFSTFCEMMYDRLGDLIDCANNTKKIKRALNHVYTVNFFIYDRLYKNESFIVDFKEMFSRLTDETVVIIGMIEADKDISNQRVDAILSKIDELKYLLHERLEKEKI